MWGLRELLAQSPHSRSECDVLFFALEYRVRVAALVRKDRDGSGRCREAQLIPGNLEIPQLFGSIPFLIPGNIKRRDEVVALDMILADVGHHGFSKLCAFRIAGSRLSPFGGGQQDNSPLPRKNYDALGAFA